MRRVKPAITEMSISARPALGVENGWPQDSTKRTSIAFWVFRRLAGLAFISID